MEKKKDLILLLGFLVGELKSKHKVDPTNITKYNQTIPFLELDLLFWIVAAGKNGEISSQCLSNLLDTWDNGGSPFEIIRSIPNLPEELKKHGIGCYNNKARTMKELVNSNLDLRNCTSDDLEKIFGIGCKTSRGFILHSRKGQKYAVIDTHILKFLKELGYDVPKSTPTKKKYKEIEKIFLSLTDDPANLDLKVWNAYATKNKEKQKELIEEYICQL